MYEKKSVFGVLRGRVQVEQAVSALNAVAFRMEKVSLLLPSPPPSVSGSFGLLVGLETLSIPGMGPVLAAGPVRTALARLPITAASLALALAAVGIPERQAKIYEEKLRAGAAMLAMHTLGGRQVDAVERIFLRHGGVAVAAYREPTTDAPSVMTAAG